MKKILMSLLLLGFMFTLAACGGEPSEPTAPEDNTAEEAAPDPTPDAEEPSEEPMEEPTEEPAEPEDEPEAPTDSDSGDTTDDGYSDPDISGDDETSAEDGYTDAPDGPGRVNADGELELTLEDLSYYDGTDGKKAYVAVDGIIYDMSGSSRWSGGNHNGYQAGQDLTSVIDNISPHGRSTLTRVPTVGILVESKAE